MSLSSNNGRLRIAIQSKGRLSDRSRTLLERIGMDLGARRDRLQLRCRNYPLDILCLRDDDIPEYVQDGVADLGIVGRNVLFERAARVEELEPLGFGRCTLALAVPQNSELEEATDLQGRRIATSHPRALARFLEAHSIEAEIVPISGSVEIAPSLGVADAICDLVSTGSTLRSNGLVQLCEVSRSEAVLIANRNTLDDEERSGEVDRMRMRIQGVRRAECSRYLMLNTSEENLAEIRQILPSLRSPTIVPLSEDGMVAVHSVVPEEVHWEVMEKLREAGGSDILVIPIERVLA